MVRKLLSLNTGIINSCYIGLNLLNTLVATIVKREFVGSEKERIRVAM